MSGAWGAIAQVAGDLLGGWLQGERSEDETTAVNNANLQINRENQQLQREFAQNGIRWRVEDAKAAGLHPLYAIGAAGSSYTPSSIPVMANPGPDFQKMGQSVGRAVSQFLDNDERELRDAQLQATRALAAKDEALAAAAWSEVARQNQSGQTPVAQSFPVSLPGQSTDLRSSVSVVGGPYEDLWGPKPLAPIKSFPPAYLDSKGEVKPGLQRYQTALGEFVLPAGGNMSEAVESLENPMIQLWVIAENAKHYGPGHRAKLKELLGDRYMWWTNPGKAVGDSVRSFGNNVRKWGGN